MKIGSLVKTLGIDRAIVTALALDMLQIDNDPDWIALADCTEIGEASPQDWLALVMVKQNEIKRNESKLSDLILKQGKHDFAVNELNQRIRKLESDAADAEKRGRDAAESRILTLERRILSLESSLREVSDANTSARSKLAALEGQIKPGDPDIKILTFFDDPILRESTLQVERHLSEGARLLDCSIAPVSSVVDGHPVTRLCRVFTLQKRIAKAQPAQPTAHAILTADFVAENLPIAHHVRQHGVADALEVMDAAAAQQIKASIQSALADPVNSALITSRPLLPATIQ